MTGVSARDSIAELLAAASRAAQARTWATAADALQQALRLSPDHADALQLLGLVRAEEGKTDEAKRLMERSLERNRAQPYVLNNLANLLLKEGARGEAIALFREAVMQKDDYGEAWVNLGAALLDTEVYDEAEQALERARALLPQDARALTFRGMLAQRRGRWDEAVSLYRQALARNPNSFVARHNLGAAFKAQGRLAEAEQAYRTAEALNAASPALHISLANLFHERGENEKALERYRRAIALKPDGLEAHRSLNEILWRQGRADEHLLSYREALERCPDSGPLRFKWAEGLYATGRTAEALAVLSEMEARGLGDATAANLCGKVLARLGDAVGGEAALRRAVELAPTAPMFRKDLAKALIVRGGEAEALEELAAALQHAPHHQELLAYQGLCWRLLGDVRASWLHNYERFIHATTLPAPEGFASIVDFNRALDRALDVFHRDRAQPSDQSFAGGTQSPAALLDKPVPELQVLRSLLESAVANYIAHLPEDPTHPFLQRVSRRFRFSGSWSIRLKSQGFHVNHVHPEGWISSSYYVAVPPEVATSERREGWIKFGESPLDLAGREEVARCIRPEIGLLVLFPSYLFHGTYPFSSKEARTTLPFDVLPVARL